MELPPFPELRLIVQRYAGVVAALELTPGEQPLVLPNGEWFPDHFTGDQPSLERLIARLQGYAGLEAIKIEAQLIGAETAAGCGPSGCGTGACSPKSAPDAQFGLTKLSDGYALAVPAAALSNAVTLTTALASMMAFIRLQQTQYAELDPVATELGAVALGFGELLLESSHIYSKSCGGPSIAKATSLGCGQLALPVALFAASEGHDIKPALAELGPTQRELLSEAWALAESNRTLVARLTKAPEKVAEGNFKLDEARSWLSRLFSRGERRPKDVESSALEALERGDDIDDIAALYEKPKDAAAKPRAPKRDDELRALVDEALGELRSESAGNGRSAAE